jgi:hypothetical protein
VRPLLARKKSSPLLSPGTLQLNLMTAPGGKIYKNAVKHHAGKINGMLMLTFNGNWMSLASSAGPIAQLHPALQN